ncbi:TylF/MycF/NovP-related O-methyltransferase [Burkholderia glumae]
MKTIFDILSNDGYLTHYSPRCDLLSGLSMRPAYPWAHISYAKALDLIVDRSGAVVEFGVGRGGMLAYLGMLEQQRQSEPRIIGFDSFAGLPSPNMLFDKKYFLSGDYAPAPRYRGRFRDLVMQLMRQYGLTARLELIEGYFNDTAVDFSFPPIKFLHLDADLYESTLTALHAAFDSVISGGIIAFDDFFHPSGGPKLAAQTFFQSRGIIPVFEVVFPIGVLMFKDDESRNRSLGVQCHDGNFYSFQLMRSLTDLAKATMEASRNSQDHSLNGLNMFLQQRPDSEADIYDYWRYLAPVWARGASQLIQREDRCALSI